MILSRLAPLALLLGVCGAASPRAAETGSKAPALDLQEVLQAPEGSHVTWDALRGKVVVLEFWATWCPSCVKAIPHLNALADELKGKPVQFISITDESPDKVAPFLAQHPIRGWVGLNTSGSMFASYSIQGRPLTVIVRPDGIIDARIAPWASPFPIRAQNLMNLAAGKPSGLVSSRVLYAGTVTDEAGHPIPGVSVRATMRKGKDVWTLIGDSAASDEAGRFRIEAEYPPSFVDEYPIRLEFHHPDYLYARLEDLRLFSATQQAELSVQLRDGYVLSGKVVDAAGRAVPAALLRATFADEDYTKPGTATRRATSNCMACHPWRRSFEPSIRVCRSAAARVRRT